MIKWIKWLEKHPEVSIIITIFLAILIFYMSSQSFEKGAPGPEFPLKSYLYHFFIFFMFAFFLAISLTRGKYNQRIFILIAILIAIMYGISDEIHQFFVPNRTCTIEDALTDSVGIMLAGVIYGWKLRNGKKKI